MSLTWVSEDDYFEAQNIPRAVRDAFTVVEALLAGEIDPLLRQSEIQIALEVHCDATGGDPALAFQAVLAALPRYRRPPEPWETDSRIANAVRMACGLTLAAEVAHRVERYAQAVVFTSTALDVLEEAAEVEVGREGVEALATLVASSKRNPLGEAATAVYAIRSPALRRARYSVHTKQWFRERTAKILPAYLASGRADPRGHACSTQGFFEHVELGMDDYLDELRIHSDETRSGSARGRATAPLVAMEYFRAKGDLAAAKREAKKAVERLEALGLWRHLERVAQYGYVVFD